MDIGSMLSDCVMGSFSVHVVDLWTERETDYDLPKTLDFSKEKELFLFTYNKISNELVCNEKSKSKMVCMIV